MATKGKQTERGQDTASQLLEAMRSAIRKYGTTGATFERVAEEAGMSRGLVHYHFGSKRRFLLEVIRQDIEQRATAMVEPIRNAQSAEEITEILRATLDVLLENDPGFFVFLFEVWCDAQRDDEMRTELAQMFARIRRDIGEVLSEKQRAGLIELRRDPEATVTLLYAFAEGYAFQWLIDPERDRQPELDAGAAMVGWLLGDDKAQGSRER